MAKNEFPLVSIITVNYNQARITCDLLESLRKITYPNWECIVVDNASPTEDPTIIAVNYPECRLIRSDKNLGFAGGNNLGVAESKGEYLLFLNNDTEVDPGFLEPLVGRLQLNPSIGMVSPKIRFFDEPDRIQYAGYTSFSKFTLRQHLIGFQQQDYGQFNAPSQTFSIHGAAMMVPLQVIRHVGLMTEIYFLYYEEHDWAEHIKRAGYSIFYEPESLVFHKESVSTGRESPLRTYYITRNRFIFARRNLRGMERILTIAYLAAVAFPKSVVKYSLTRRFDLVKATYKAYFWNFFSTESRNLSLKY